MSSICHALGLNPGSSFALADGDECDSTAEPANDTMPLRVIRLPQEQESIPIMNLRHPAAPPNPARSGIFSRSHSYWGISDGITRMLSVHCNLCIIMSTSAIWCQVQNILCISRLWRGICSFGAQAPNERTHTRSVSAWFMRSRFTGMPGEATYHRLGRLTGRV